ncbi:hypothetical protein MSG92_19400 [Acinetobacter seifertii]|uniref:hypothetical protein n=1 Tax=Acinetobacter seifertii TaxID=1530123 RepID=UPI0029410183|nr:hypothetical protein [Acinetobacter seifertii]MDV4266125.1 hypothetical protein [Acinetobacter seifertii]
MDAKTLVNNYLNSAVTILSECDITFKDFDYDAIDITKRRLNGYIVSKDREDALYWYWNYIDERKAPMEFYNKDILRVRLGICLLAKDIDQVEDFNEHVSWFVTLMALLHKAVLKGFFSNIIFK